MSANINKKPPLILQVARGGSTQQARKKYKLTENEAYLIETATYEGMFKK